MTARFITFEGGEGAGKSTQLRLLADTLRARGGPVTATREPGGSAGAELLRSVLLNGEQNWSPEAETLLHFAARAEHVARTIRPALAAGQIVLCDRFCDSTLAYQGYGQGVALAKIEALIAQIGVRPDLTLVFEVSPEVARARLAARGGGADRYERLGPDFHARVAAGFRTIAAANPDRCVIVPADGEAAAVQARVLAIVELRLPSSLIRLAI